MVLRAGRNLLPFSREWQLADQLKLIERSMLAALSPGEGGQALGAEARLVVSPYMEIAFGGYNPDSSEEDEKQTPDWLFQGIVRPIVDGLDLSGTIYRSLAEGYWAGSAGFCLVREELDAVGSVEGEILFNGSKVVRQRGWKLMGSYGVIREHLVLPLTEFVARYATVHALDSDDEKDQVALGVNFYVGDPARRNRVGFNYVWDRDTDNTIRRALVQLQVSL